MLTNILSFTKIYLRLWLTMLLAAMGLQMLFTPASAATLYVGELSLVRERTAGLLIPFCAQLSKSQQGIEDYITTYHSGNANNYVASENAISTTDFTSILGVAPSILGTTSGCPTILMQLGNNHTDTTQRQVYFDQVKLKSIATCNNNGSILKWTSYTDLNYRSLSIAVRKNNCLDVHYDGSVTLN